MGSISEASGLRRGGDVASAMGSEPPARLDLRPVLLVCLAVLAGAGCQAVPAARREVARPGGKPRPEAQAPDPGSRKRDARQPELDLFDLAILLAALPEAPKGGDPHAPDGSGDSDPSDEDEDKDEDKRGASRPRRRGRSFLGIPPLQELIDDSTGEDDPDDDGTSLPGSPYFPESRDDPIEPDIRKPGPDTANFPNSPYTLPQGRLYLEASPVFFSGPSRGSPRTYNAEFLLRFGLTDRVELRLFGNGVTYERQRGQPDTGMAPLAWDLKMMFWKENEKAHIPAVGLEVFLLTPSGSRHLNQGTQPSLNLLFDYTLPWGFLLEWNVGVVGDPSPNNHFSAIEPAAAWALQHEIVEGFDVFFQGYFNGPTLPRFGDGVELGGGAIWAVNTRISFFGSYNAGVSQAAPNTLVQFGGAVAF